ncbi:helix-turn-helix domain-containing protein [Streptomyces sp. NBC_00286]|uniref:helix-turn-helix domain-containing protein n=1 Tax=Streptomyces sp. NBC_00286 TaxID=2975701 RepID=UPI002E29FAA1|nr:helix-turn-helix domain-containing protein [Streptomyces sp. NBC_00286]
MSSCTESERFAACLRSLKERSGLSYAALAAKAGASGSSVHRYCSGTSVPHDYGTVHRLAVACGAAPEELRTLHKLWALADAAREPEAEPPERVVVQPDPLAGPPEPVAGPPDPADLGDLGVGHGADGGAADMAAAPADVRREPADVRREPADVRREPADVRREPSDVRREPSDGSGAVGWRRRRIHVGVAVGLVLLLGGLALTLPSQGPDEDSDGGGGGAASAEVLQKTDHRLLFTPACREVVAMGQHDACVREIQELLKDKGTVIGVDSDFGPETLRRVTAFQVYAGIEPANGVVGDATKKALYESQVRLNAWSKDKVRRHIRAVFTEAPDRAIAIADCQSFLDPLHILPNTNGTRNWGLFQISDARLRELGGTPRKALDPEWNILAAKRLWSQDRDFSDWPHCDRAFSPTPSASP